MQMFIDIEMLTPFSTRSFKGFGSYMYMYTCQDIVSFIL